MATSVNSAKLGLHLILAEFTEVAILVKTKKSSARIVFFVFERRQESRISSIVFMQGRKQLAVQPNVLLCIRQFGASKFLCGQMLQIRKPKLALLEDSAIRTGLDTCAQQIAWGVPKLLAFALQALTLAAIHKPELISYNALEAILSGISQMEKQTKIGVEDTIESACTKGHIRENAAALARALNRGKLCGDRPEILAKWMDIIRDKDEFAEIRNAGNQY